MSSPLEKRFLQLWQLQDGPELEHEYRFHPTRRWKADFAHIPSRTIFEIEGGVWCRGRHTSPKGFMADAEKYLKIFTFLSEEEIKALAEEHAADPGQRPLQKRLAREVTIMVHSEADYNAAVEASQILFSNSANEALKNIDEATLLDIFEGVPQFEVSAEDIKAGVPVLDLLAVKSGVFASKGEARKMVQGGGVSINKEKIADPNAVVSEEVLLNGKYILVQRGKKNYYLLIVK
jgi:tyrosyl-tRNA synthetase